MIKFTANKMKGNLRSNLFNIIEPMYKYTLVKLVCFFTTIKYCENPIKMSSKEYIEVNNCNFLKNELSKF